MQDWLRHSRESRWSHGNRRYRRCELIARTRIQQSGRVPINSCVVLRNRNNNKHFDGRDVHRESATSIADRSRNDGKAMRVARWNNGSSAVARL